MKVQNRVPTLCLRLLIRKPGSKCIGNHEKGYLDFRRAPHESLPYPSFRIRYSGLSCGNARCSARPELAHRGGSSCTENSLPASNRAIRAPAHATIAHPIVCMTAMWRPWSAVLHSAWIAPTFADWRPPTWHAAASRLQRCVASVPTYANPAPRSAPSTPMPFVRPVRRHVSNVRMNAGAWRKAALRSCNSHEYGRMFERRNPARTRWCSRMRRDSGDQSLRMPICFVSAA